MTAGPRAVRRSLLVEKDDTERHCDLTKPATVRATVRTRKLGGPMAPVKSKHLAHSASRRCRHLFDVPA